MANTTQAMFDERSVQAIEQHKLTNACLSVTDGGGSEE